VQLSIIIFQADGGTGWAARNRLYDLADRSTALPFPGLGLDDSFRGAPAGRAGSGDVTVLDQVSTASLASRRERLIRTGR
jgi:hypothetical protein